MPKASKSFLIAIAATGMFLATLTAGVLTSNQAGPSSSIVSDANVGVFLDSACTNNCTRIDWGNLAPTNSTTKAVWVKNTGAIPLTLSMATTSWIPSNANTYLTVSWDRSGYVLAEGSSVPAVFTLTVSESTGDLTGFNFNIVVTGTE